MDRVSACPRVRVSGCFIFPTRVGMDRKNAINAITSSYFPHTRGDGPGTILNGLRQIGFSPHAWGWTAIPILDFQATPIFPTRVGMDRLAAYILTCQFYFPHTRGDGPRLPPSKPQNYRFSPHAWGWTAKLDNRAGP